MNNFYSSLYLSAFYSSLFCFFHFILFFSDKNYYACLFPILFFTLEPELNEFEPRLGWFYLKLFSIFQDLSRRSIETGFCGI